MPNSSDKNLDQSVIGIIGREDFCKILSAKKVELRRQIQELTEKLNSVCKILKQLSAQNPESSILEPIEDRKRSRKARKKSRNKKGFRGIKLSEVSALTANILKGGRSFSEDQIKRTLIKRVKEGGFSARGVHLTLKRALEQPDFHITSTGKWRLTNRQPLGKK